MIIGRNDAKAEAPVLWPLHEKNWLIGKDSDVGRDWAQEEKGMTEDEMTGWHQLLDGREFEWTPEVGDGQEGLACWFMGSQRVGHDWATELNWTEYSIVYMYQNFLIHSSGRWILNHWTTREVPEMRFKMSLWFNFLTSLVIVSEIDWD